MMNRNKLPTVTEVESSADNGDMQNSDDKWDTMYQKLVQFHAKHGHSNVPSRYPADPALGFWVSTQRRQFRRLNADSETEQSSFVIHPERKRKLEELQFQFSAKDPNSLSWEERFKQLKDFVTKYGHPLVPIKWKENPQLASWVSRQRQEYRHREKGLPSRLTDERLEMLDSLGFVWEPKRGAPRREEGLKEVPRAPQHDPPQDKKCLSNSDAVPAVTCNVPIPEAQGRPERLSASAMEALMASLGQNSTSSTSQESQHRLAAPSPLFPQAPTPAPLSLPGGGFYPLPRPAESNLRDRLLETAIHERFSQLSAEETCRELRRLSLSGLLALHSDQSTPGTQSRLPQGATSLTRPAGLSFNDPTGIQGPLTQSSRNMASLAASNSLLNTVPGLRFSQAQMPSGANNVASLLAGNRAASLSANRNAALSPTSQAILLRHLTQRNANLGRTHFM